MSEKEKKPIYKRWWVWVIVAVIGIGISANLGNNNVQNNIGTATPTNTALNTPANTAAASPKVQNTPAATSPSVQNTPAPTAESRADSGIWKKAGMYKIGTDLQSGEYILKSAGAMPAYYELTKDSTGTLESILSNDNFTGTRYITASDGQYLKVTGAQIAPAGDVSAQQSTNGRYSEGMYKVGKDIQAGEYKVISDSDMGYVEVSSNSTGSLESIISNDNFSGEKYITVSDGQYLKLVRCYIPIG